MNQPTVMQRFALFAFDDYYPGGGWADFVASFASVEEAAEHARTLPRDQRQIIDSTDGADVTPTTIL